VGLTGCAVAVWTLFATLWFEMPPRAVLEETARNLAAPVLAAWHGSDVSRARELQRRSLIAPADLAGLIRENPTHSWSLLSAEVPGFVLLTPSQEPLPAIPFVYESVQQPHHVELLQRYDLGAILAEATSEYDAMLRFGAWMGTRWQHGYEPARVPGGRLHFQVADVIAAGEGGARFWCEIDAKATVQAAAALGWPARLVSVCPEPHRPATFHAVAELWSNQYEKWFVLDTDFNVVFEAGGVPMSAWELTHLGSSMLRAGTLHLREFAPDPRGVGADRILSLYRFIFVDMRNDWVSRRLPRGSPAGGDLATWWTAQPDMEHVFTAKRKVDDQERFDWRVNTTGIHLIDLHKEASAWRLNVALTAYAPYFDSFWIQVDGGEWTELDSPVREISLLGGTHDLRARIKTVRSDWGSITRVAFSLP
jgi:hypothetical protein